MDDLLKYYFIKISSVIIKKEIINFNKFDSFLQHNQLWFNLRIAEKYKGLGFQYKSLNIEYIKITLPANRKMFYKEFLYWIKKQILKKIFRQNKQFLFKRLEYLRLI